MRLCLLLLGLALVAFLATSAQAQPVMPEPNSGDGVCGSDLQMVYGLNTADATVCTPTNFQGTVVDPASINIQPGTVAPINDQAMPTQLRVRASIRRRAAQFTCRLTHRPGQFNAMYNEVMWPSPPPEWTISAGPGPDVAIDSGFYTHSQMSTMPIIAQIVCQSVPAPIPNSPSNTITTTQIVARWVPGSPALVVGQASLSPSPAAAGVPVTATATLTALATDTFVFEKRAVGSMGAFTTVTTTSTTYTTTLASATFTAASGDDNYEYRFVGTRAGMPATVVTGDVSAAHRVVSSGVSGQTHASTVVGGATMTFTVTGITGGAGATAELWTVGMPDTQVTTAMCAVNSPAATAQCTVPAVAAHDNRQFRIVVKNGGASFSSTPTAVQRVVSAGNPATGPIVILPATAQTLTATASGAGTITWQRRTGTDAFADYTNMNCQPVTTAGSQTVTCAVGNTPADDNFEYRVRSVLGADEAVSGTPTLVRVVSAGTTTITHTSPIAQGQTMTFQVTGITGGATVATLRTTVPNQAVTAMCGTITGGSVSCTLVANGATHDGKQFRIAVANGMTDFITGTPTAPQQVVSTGATTTATSPVVAGGTMTFTSTGVTGGATTATLESSSTAGGMYSTVTAMCNIAMTTATCTVTGATAAQDNLFYRIIVANGAVSFTSATPVQHRVVSAAAPTPDGGLVIPSGTTRTLTAQGSGAGTLTWQRRTGGGAFADYSNTNCPSTTTAGVQTVSCQVGNQASDDNFEYRLRAVNGAVFQESTTVTIRVVFTGTTTTSTSPVAAGGTMTFSSTGVTGGATTATLESSSMAGGMYTSVTAMCNIAMTTATCTVTGATAAQDNLFYRIVVANGMISFASTTPVQHRVVSTGATTSDTNPILTGATMTFRTTAITGGVTNGIALESAANAMGPWTPTGATCPAIMATATTASCTLAAVPTHDNQLFRIVVSNGAASFSSATPVTQQVVSAGSPTPVSVRAILVGGTQVLTAQASGAGGAGAGTIVWQRRTGGGMWAAYGACPTVTTAGNQAALTCTVTGVANEDNYEYRVLSTNGAVTQASTTPVLIRVVAITTQPVNKVIAENTAGSPMFTADGHGDGTFEWQYQKPMTMTWTAVAAGTDFPTGLSGQATKQLTFTAGNNNFHDQWKFRLRVYNNQCGGCGTGGIVEAFSNDATLTVVAVTVDPTNRVVVSGGSTNPAYSFTGINFQTQRWQQNCLYTPPAQTTLASTQWSDMSPAETAATLTVATSNANPMAMAGAGAKNGCLYRVVIRHTASGVESQSEPASLREVFYTMASTTLAHRAKYDYYATGSVLTAPAFTEQQLPIAYSATNLQVISNLGVRSNQQCTLTLKYSTASGLGNAAVNMIMTGNALSQTFTLGTTTSPGAVAINPVPATTSTPNPTPNGLIGHTQARALNGGLLSLSCADGVTYADSQPLTLYYPPLLSTAPNQRWSANPPNFVTNGYVDFPEPGHWNYLDQQVARLEFLFDGNPTVIGVGATVTFNFKDALGNVRAVAVGTPNPNVPKASVAAPAPSTVVVPNTVPVASALTIASLTITEARENYHNKILSVTAAFPTPPADTINTGAVNLGAFAGFTQLLFQPTSYTLDAGVLSPHYPPVLITVEPLTSEETNFPDTGVYRWPTRVLFHGFPKHDSQFGNAPYSSQPAPAVSVFPKRNYNQKLEYRSHDGMAYRTTLPLYREAATAMGQPSPTITLVPSTNPNIPGVLEANSVIDPATTTPLRLYNKWVYRWVLGVYRVDGTYEPYVEGRDLTTTPAYLSYYGISGGFLGIWNWYPREFVPALCPTVMGPYALGLVDQLVTPAPLSATMYPRPAAGVLAWDYAHHTVNQWSLVDMTQPSTTLTGVANGESPLLPAVPGVNHLFKSTFTVIESTVPSVLPMLGVPEIIGFEVKCEGRINTILSSDANSIITPKYTHTLPDLLGATKGQRTIRGFPNMVLTNNCKQVATLSTAAATPTPVTHRGGETLVFEFAAGTGTVQVQVKDNQETGAPFVTAFSVTLNPAQTTTKQWTTRYKSDKTPVTVTSVQLNVAVTPAVKVHTHEYSNIPVSWPFATANAVLPGAAANEAFTQCIAPRTVAANANANLAALTQQYHGCGTATATTAPSGNGC